MKYAVRLTLFGIFLVSICFVIFTNDLNKYDDGRKSFEEKEAASNSSHPANPALLWRSDFFSLPASDYRKIVQKALQLRDSANCSSHTLAWQADGPDNIGGRVTDIEMPSGDMQNIYVGTASGGIWHSPDAGRSWLPIFDQQATLAIGDLAIAPTAPHRLYAGTGEPNGGGGSIAYDGLGVFRSDDRGETWRQMGLENSGSIGRIIVHPQNENIAFVGAMGRLFANNAERGVFRTGNGGQSWEKVLYVNDSTGCIDLAAHPSNPNIIYAAMWERVRRPHYKRYGGPSGGIYKSEDGGQTWQKMLQGLPNTYVGRIGLAVSPAKPDRVYAIYADNYGIYRGLFVSNNSGDTWQEIPNKNLFEVFNNYGWWFGRITADPNNANHLFIVGIDLFESYDGGKKWDNISAREKVHCDQHALFIPARNSRTLLLGNDGGLYISYSAGRQWEHVPMPITQFYTCAAIQDPSGQTLYGGTQDNGIVGKIKNSPLTDYKWLPLSEGDGFDIIVNPANRREMLMTLQYGEVYESKNSGFVWKEANDGISLTERRNWRVPIKTNPQNPAVIYYATERLYKRTWDSPIWKRVNPMREQPVFSPHAPPENDYYGAASAMSIAPSDSNYIYIGTNDGQLLRSTNNGYSFAAINNNSQIPQKWVSCIAVSPNNPQYVVAALSGYRNNESCPYLFLSKNGGNNWENIGTGLPPAPVNCIAIHPTAPYLLFIGTDIGVFVSNNYAGKEQKWLLAGSQMPIVPVMDLTFGQNGKQLIAATFGRSVYTLDINFFLADYSNDNNKANPKP